MTQIQRKALLVVNYAAAVAISLAALFLISIPFHPPTNDTHGGLYFAFGGLLLLPVALVPFAAAEMFRRNNRYAWVMQLIVCGLFLILGFAIYQ